MKIKKEKNIPSIEFYKVLEKESLSFYDLDNTFIVFESYDNLVYLVCSNVNLSILLYNLNDEKKYVKLKMLIKISFKILDIIMIKGKKEI